jgi:hypothetical protein
MQLVRFRDKGLRQLHEDGNARGVPSAMADKLRKLVSPSKPPKRWSSSAGFPAGSCIRLKAT